MLMAYKIENGTVYFKSQQLPKADAGSFEVFFKIYFDPSYEGQDEKTIQYAKDKKYIYINEKIIAQADVASFELLTFPFAKDKDTVFKLDQVQTQWDVATFTVLEKKIIYTHVHYYGNGDCTEIHRFFLKDHHQVATDLFDSEQWHKSDFKLLSDADLATFEVLNMPIAKDQFYVYNWEKKLEQFHAPSFEYINDGYYKDRAAVYQSPPRFVPIKNAIPATFQRLEEDFAKDESSAYFREQIIEGADAASFEVIERKINGISQETQAMIQSYIFFPRHIAKDKYHLFTSDIRVPFDVDVNSFEYISGIYAKDKFSAYYIYTTYDPSQKTDCYYKVEKIEGADTNTFQRISLKLEHRNYAKDKNHVYFHGKKIPAEELP